MSRFHNGLDVISVRARFDHDEVASINRTLSEHGVDERLVAGGGYEREEIFADVQEGQLDEFLERLDTVGQRADVYLPIRFERPFGSSTAVCGSLPALRVALKSLRGELEIELDPSERSPRLARQRNLWRWFSRGAKAALASGSVLDVVRV